MSPSSPRFIGNAPEPTAPVTSGVQIDSLFLTTAKLRTWGVRSFWALLDQGLTSGTGFAISILLARWMAADVYGAFAIAFAGYLFVAGLHNVLLVEPLSVMGPSTHASRLRAYFCEQLIVHALLACPLSIATIVAGVCLWRVAPQSPLGGAVIGSGLVLPLLLLLWLVRRMCYVIQRPSAAVWGSCVYFFLVTVGLFVLRGLDRTSPLLAFFLMGFASLLGSVILLKLVVFVKKDEIGRERLAWRGILRENWRYGRWLVGSTVLYSVSSQTQIFLLAGFVGLGAAGVLRAMQVPSMAMTQINTAIALLVLPAFSYDFGQGLAGHLRRKAMIVSVGLGSVGLCFVGFLAIFGKGTEHLLFGDKYAGFAWLMAILALIPVANGLGSGYSMALRASQKPHYDLIANAIAAPVGIVTALLFMRLWGLAGAAASMVVAMFITCIVNISSYVHSRSTL